VQDEIAEREASLPAVELVRPRVAFDLDAQATAEVDPRTLPEHVRVRVYSRDLTSRQRRHAR
jgi:hypothetical protein